MMKPAIALIAASALTLPAGTLAAANVEIDASGPVVELNVFETVDVAPDTATIGAGVTSEAATATEALRQNSAEMQKVIARIKALGVAEKDIQTSGINLNARYDYDQQTQRQVFRGYQVSNRVSVILRKIDDTGRVLDALVEAGANDLSGPNFSIDDDTAAKNAARSRAVARAEAQAKAYAAMLGYDGAKVLSISESITGNGPMPEMAKARGMMVMSADAAPVQPGMIAAGVSLSITYELVRNGATPAQQSHSRLVQWNAARHCSVMKRNLALILGSLAALALAPVPASAQEQARGDQGEARRESQAGNIMRSGEIEARILPMMKGAEYLGFAYDSSARAYRLKFIKDGRVTHVDVDARTGRIIGRSR